MNRIYLAIINGRRGQTSEQGIALLFTLGILSLLLVLALSFATVTSVDRKCAIVNNDVASARLLVDSTFERVLGSMHSFFQERDTNDKPFKIPFDVVTMKSNGSGGALGIDQSLTARIPVVDSPAADSDYLTYYDAVGNPDSINWELITNTEESGNPIIGRVAYVVLPNETGLSPEIGKVDPGEGRFGKGRSPLQYLDLTKLDNDNLNYDWSVFSNYQDVFDSNITAKDPQKNTPVSLERIAYDLKQSSPAADVDKLVDWFDSPRSQRDWVNTMTSRSWVDTDGNGVRGEGNYNTSSSTGENRPRLGLKDISALILGKDSDNGNVEMSNKEVSELFSTGNAGSTQRFNYLANMPASVLKD